MAADKCEHGLIVLDLYLVFRVMEEDMFLLFGPGLEDLMTDVAGIAIGCFNFHVFGLILVTLLVMPFEVPLSGEDLEAKFAGQLGELGSLNIIDLFFFNQLVDFIFNAGTKLVASSRHGVFGVGHLLV